MKCVFPYVTHVVLHTGYDFWFENKLDAEAFLRRELDYNLTLIAVFNQVPFGHIIVPSPFGMECPILDIDGSTQIDDLLSSNRNHSMYSHIAKFAKIERYTPYCKLDVIREAFSSPLFPDQQIADQKALEELQQNPLGDGYARLNYDYTVTQPLMSYNERLAEATTIHDLVIHPTQSMSGSTQSTSCSDLYGSVCFNLSTDTESHCDIFKIIDALKEEDSMECYVMELESLSYIEHNNMKIAVLDYLAD